jgi:hypothetical protein
LSEVGLDLSLEVIGFEVGEAIAKRIQQVSAHKTELSIAELIG